VDEEELVAELYRVPPGEFVAARNAKVRELRAAGERDAAAAIAKLRRPNTTEWALNMASREHSGPIAGWADAADAVRDAQEAAATGQRVDLRTALTTLRARTADVMSAASEWAPSDALSLALHEVAASPDTTNALRAGVLGAPGEPASRPGTVPARSEPRRSTRTTEASAKPDKAELRHDREADKARAAVEQAAAGVDEAKAAATAAADAQRAAEAELTAATEEVQTARRQLQAAEAGRRDAEKRHRDTRRVATEAAKKLDRAQRAHDAAVSRLDHVTKSS
jgi:hypothetical protein